MVFTQTFFRRFLLVAQLFLLTLFSVVAVEAQRNRVDTSFNAVPSKEATNSGKLLIQPDGKILIFGVSFTVNGTAKGQIARLNTDGSLDNSFNCPTCDFNIFSAVIQPDGKIIVAGLAPSNTANFSVARIMRLNPDGSQDLSFSSPFYTNGEQVNSIATVWAIQPDGKIIAQTTALIGGVIQSSIFRLNPNGTFDNTFSTINLQSGQNSSQFVSRVLLQPNGKILVGGNSNATQSAGFLSRYNADGTRDTTFGALVLSSSGMANNSTYINDFDVQPDGRIMIVGRFTAVNGVVRTNIARLSADGNVDLSFYTANLVTPDEIFNRVRILPNGQILVSTGSSNPNSPDSQGGRFFRFNQDGSLDAAFTSPSALIGIGSWVIDSEGRIILSGGFLENGTTVYKYARLNTDGSLDATFNVNAGRAGTVSALAVQPDGKVILNGDFTLLDGIPRRGFARVNTNGSLDTSFNSGTGFDGRVEKIVVQPDGKILVGGSFNSYNGSQQSAIARLNQDGSLDTSFSPSVVPTVYAIALQPDGSIIIGGDFTIVNGATRIGIARLNADGTIDSAFNPTLESNATGSIVIRSIVFQGRGKIFIGGAFSSVNGLTRTNIARLNIDGTVDTDFNAAAVSPVRQIELLPDGKYMILTDTILRLNSDGTTDAAFHSPTFGGVNSSGNLVNVFAAQSDGSVIVGGNFTSVNGVQRLRIARLQTDGSLDSAFSPSGANGQILAMVKQSDGRILVGGEFTIIGNLIRFGIARIITDASRVITLYDFDGDGRADISVFRPSNGVWYELRSQNNSLFGMQFGQANDRLAPADYDGDGKTDVAVFRDNVPNAGNRAYFFITNSSDNSFHPVQFGATGDIPVSGDWDGDGKADLAVYRDGSLTGGQSYFFYRPSSQPGVDFRAVAWGAAGDKPVMGDFDGDGKLDAAVFRPSNGVWYILKSSDNQVIQVQFGLGTDIPVPMDYSGDGITDIAVYRPSNGYWYIARSTANAAQNFDAIQFGAAGDLPVPADYDGDGKADVAVYRPSNGGWYLQQSTNGFTAVQFGATNDKPIPNAYIR